MKDQHQSSGRGDPTIKALLQSMARYDGGTCSGNVNGLKLSFRDQSSIFVAYRPSSADEWRTRLKWVEKHCARILLAPTILYAIDTGRGRKSQQSALRLSIALTLSMGRPVPTRYSVLLKSDGKGCTIADGGELGTKGHTTYPIATLQKWAQKLLPKLAQGAVEACEKYKVRPDVESALQVLADNRRRELTNLNDLYRRKSGTSDRLLGLAEPNASGSSTIETELRERQRLVLERYSVQVRFRVLSLGVFTRFN